MNNPITETASWQTQYYLTVSSGYGSPTGQGWYNSGATANFAVSSPVGGGAGTQYVFASWAGSGSGSYTGSASSSSCTMNAPITETASWQTQYYLTVSSSNGNPQGQGWYNAGSSASFSVTTPASGGTGTQYVFASWSGSGTGSYSGTSSSQSVTMNNPITETASWTTQYQLTTSTNYGTVSPASGNWYNAGATVTISATAPSAGSGEQYAWNGWTGSGSGSYTGNNNPATNEVTMNGPITETASWTHQYYLTVSSSYGSPTGQGWYNAGASASFSVTSPASGGTGIQYVFKSWSGSGTGSYSGTSSSQSVTMNNPITETASWQTQYEVTFTESGLDTSTPSVTVLTVNGTSVENSDFNYTIWVYSEDSLVCFYNSTVVISGNQYDLANVTVNLVPPALFNPEQPLTNVTITNITGPLIVNATYTDPFQAALTQSSIGGDAVSNIVLSVGSTNCTYISYPLLFGLKKKPRLRRHLSLMAALENQFFTQVTAV
jgi:hypothetical protein